MSKEIVEVFRCDRCKKVIQNKVHCVTFHVEIMTTGDGCYIEEKFAWHHLCGPCRERCVKVLKGLADD